MPPRKLFKEMQPNELIEGVFAIQNSQLGQTRNGKPFLKCLLADRSKRVPGRMWNITEDLFKSLPPDGFIWLEGQTQDYQGELQVVIQQIAPIDPSPAELEQLLPTTQYDINQMFDELCARLDTLQHPGIKALAQAYLGDEALMEKFRKAPAAMTLHHAYLGGLLEHTLQLLKLADVICPLYPTVNRDIVMMGLFLHDLGKCVELTWETGFGYSDDGQLVGHIARGVIMLQKKVDDVRPFGIDLPEPIVRVLHHIILSHHGVPEFGALKIPATPEALAVSLIDNLDAKLNMVNAAAGRGEINEEEMRSHFTEKVWSLDTRVYRPDPTTVQEE